MRQPREQDGGLLQTRSCFGGVALYPPHVLLDEACSYMQLEVLKTNTWPLPKRLVDDGGGGGGGGDAPSFISDSIALEAARVQAQPPLSPAMYTDNRGSTCEHIALHYCMAAVFNTKLFIDDNLRVW